MTCYYEWMKSTIFTNNENTQQEHRAFVSQNLNTLLVNLNGTIYSKQGAMAAYQGNIDFSFEGGGVNKMFKKMVTGENLSFMKCSGQGDLFLADNGSQIHIVELEDEEMTINGPNLVAFESSLTWDIKMIKAGLMGFVAGGGLFNTTIEGSGLVAVSSWGNPFVIAVDQTTYVDINCVIAWSSALSVDVKSSFKAGALIGRGSGEAFQMAFSGQGFVVVQPGEGMLGSVPVR